MCAICTRIWCVRPVFGLSSIIDHFGEVIHGLIPNTHVEGITLYSVSAVSPQSSITIFASSVLPVLRRIIEAFILPASGVGLPDTRA